MTLYAGVYPSCVWHGVLREGGYPMYVCTHDHKNPDDAKVCARKAKKHIQTTKPDVPLPAGWKLHDTSRDS